MSTSSMKFSSKMIFTPGSTESFLNQTGVHCLLRGASPLLLSLHTFRAFSMWINQNSCVLRLHYTLENWRPELVTNQDLESENRTIGALF